MLASVCLIASSASAQTVVTHEELNLAVGENRTISAENVKNYSEGAGGIVEVKVAPGGNQFVIVGQKPGSTSLLLLRKDGSELIWTINVFPQPAAVVEAELSQLLEDAPGIRVRRLGARFFIEGGVTTEPEIHRIEHIAALYPGQVESLVVLGGVAADRKINLRVDLYFVQYEKTHNYQFGVSWPATIGGVAFSAANLAYDFLANATITAEAALVDQPLPGLDLAARNGWAKVLKHATVITANGSQAEYSSGGQQWFPVTNGLTATLREIKFGTTLKILPRFDPKTGEMQLTVGAEVADLTPPVTSATDLPGQNTSNLNTAVALKLGQSLVLSGIRTSTERKTNSGVPWLSEIPILGLLFGSEGKQSEDVEGAVFIVPSVLENVSKESADQVQRAVHEYEEYDGDLDEVAPMPKAKGAP